MALSGTLAELVIFNHLQSRDSDRRSFRTHPQYLRVIDWLAVFSGREKEKRMQCIYTIYLAGKVKGNGRAVMGGELHRQMSRASLLIFALRGAMYYLLDLGREGSV